MNFDKPEQRAGKLSKQYTPFTYYQQSNIRWGLQNAVSCGLFVGKMPGKPFSAKAKKLQMQEKRERKRAQPKVCGNVCTVL